VIDLHLHTTASDGRSTPETLVQRAAAAGITKLAVTDHDTTAGIEPVRASAARFGIEVIAGIEITSVHDGKDVHMLGYFIDEYDAALAEFLGLQRADRRRRIEDMLDRLSELGIELDREALMRQSEGRGKSIGRPVIARALIEGGHVKDIAEAFDRYLSPGRPRLWREKAPRLHKCPRSFSAPAACRRSRTQASSDSTTSSPASPPAGSTRSRSSIQTTMQPAWRSTGVSRPSPACS
jgi:predicted metal-dependent phosphoesterase TrpH